MAGTGSPGAAIGRPPGTDRDGTADARDTTLGHARYPYHGGGDAGAGSRRGADPDRSGRDLRHRPASVQGRVSVRAAGHARPRICRHRACRGRRRGARRRDARHLRPQRLVRRLCRVPPRPGQSVRAQRRHRHPPRRRLCGVRGVPGTPGDHPAGRPRPAPRGVLRAACVHAARPRHRRSGCRGARAGDRRRSDRPAGAAAGAACRRRDHAAHPPPCQARAGRQAGRRRDRGNAGGSLPHLAARRRPDARMRRRSGDRGGRCAAHPQRRPRRRARCAGARRRGADRAVRPPVP